MAKMYAIDFAAGFSQSLENGCGNNKKRAAILANPNYDQVRESIGELIVHRLT